MDEDPAHRSRDWEGRQHHPFPGAARAAQGIEPQGPLEQRHPVGNGRAASLAARGGTTPYVIAEPCIGTCDTACVRVCPGPDDHALGPTGGWTGVKGLWRPLPPLSGSPSGGIIPRPHSSKCEEIMPKWGLTVEQRKSKPWGLPADILEPGKTITDPVHGDIYLTQLESWIVDSPPMQRLRRT